MGIEPRLQGFPLVVGKPDNGILNFNQRAPGGGKLACIEKFGERQFPRARGSCADFFITNHTKPFSRKRAQRAQRNFFNRKDLEPQRRGRGIFVESNPIQPIQSSVRSGIIRKSMIHHG
jgi:hypothetical protein